MMIIKRTILICLLLNILPLITVAQEARFITVSQDGKGDFTTISAAIRSLPAFNYQRTVILIKNGIYNEKLRIEKDYITLRGESREKTIIRYSQLRSDWDAKKDSIGPAVINIYGDDFILENLTVENTQPQIGPHAFALYGTGTRTVVLNCNVISKGADTVSLWDNKTGMYYHANCYFEGAVDFVCPRGWCFIRDSKFYEVKKTASLWHAGGDDITQKFVVVYSSFDGIEGWELGRHHYEAQFYLIDCKFSSSMSAKPIYRVTYPNEPEKDRPFNWGPRYYFSDCFKEGTQLEWLKNNLETADGSPAKSEISAAWTFGHKWDPERTDIPKIIKYKINGNSLLLFFDEKITIIGKPVIQSNDGSILKYNSGGGSDTIAFTADTPIDKSRLVGLRITNSSKIIASSASVQERDADLNLK